MRASVFVATLVAIVSSGSSGADWALWGGPHRDFQVKSSEPLADFWPTDGPPKLWERQLGEGYSAIAVRGEMLYTIYRHVAAFWQLASVDQEVIVALDAATGTTKWQFAYEAPFDSGQGPGPHAMPQLVGNLLFAVGVNGKLHALNAKTGKLVWMRDLYRDLGGGPRW
jgi:hypothetical protein